MKNSYIYIYIYIYIYYIQCRTQKFFGHTFKCSGTGEHGQKLYDILKLSKFSACFEKRNNSWTKSWMNLKFQLSLCLIISQSLQFWFLLKKCLICAYWLLRKICFSPWLPVKNTIVKLLKFYLNEKKLNDYLKFWPIYVLKYLAFNMHNFSLLFCLFLWRLV